MWIRQSSARRLSNRVAGSAAALVQVSAFRYSQVARSNRSGSYRSVRVGNWIERLDSRAEQPCRMRSHSGFPHPRDARTGALMRVASRSIAMGVGRLVNAERIAQIDRQAGPPRTKCRRIRNVWLPRARSSRGDFGRETGKHTCAAPTISCSFCAPEGQAAGIRSVHRKIRANAVTRAAPSAIALETRSA